MRKIKQMSVFFQIKSLNKAFNILFRKKSSKLDCFHLFCTFLIGLTIAKKFLVGVLVSMFAALMFFEHCSNLKNDSHW